MRAYRVYLLISGVFAFGFACAYTLNLIYQITIVGLGPLELVLVGTALEVVCLVAQVPTGIIADLYSRRLSVIIGFVLIGLGSLIEGLLPAFGAILVATAVWGVGATCVDGALEAWVTDEVGEAKAGSVFTRGAQVDQVFTVVGIGASAALALIGLNLPLVVGGLVMIALAAVLVVVMPEGAFVRSEHRPGRAMRQQLVAGAGAVRGRPVLLCLLGATAFVGLGSEGFDRLSQAHLLGGGVVIVGLAVISVAATLGSVALTEVVRRRTDVTRPGPTLVWLQGLTVVAMFAFAFAGSLWLTVAGMLAVSLLRSASRPLRTAWIATQTDPATRATVFSFAGMVDAAGEIGGGPPVGLVGQRLGVRSALFATGLLTAPAVLLLAAAVTRQRRTPHGVERARQIHSLGSESSA